MLGTAYLDFNYKTGLIRKHISLKSVKSSHAFLWELQSIFKLCRRKKLNVLIYSFLIETEI